jgi:hypothetical protein
MTPVTKAEFRAPSQVAPSAAPLTKVSPAPLVGTWTNSTSNNVVKAVITDNGGKFEVNLYGACEPAPCNWGAIAAMPYAATVSGGAAVAFSANYSFSFSTVIVVGHLSGSELILETLTHFTDGSGRADFYVSETMKK